MPQRFNDSGAALLELQSGYNAWTAKLSDICLQACYAIIAGLFTLFGSTGSLLSNGFAMASIIVVFIVLGLNILLRRIIAKQFYNQIVYAEQNQVKWEAEFTEYKKSGGFWPYTDSLECNGDILRFINVWGVLLAAILLIAAAVSAVTSVREKPTAAGTALVATNAIAVPTGR